MSKNEKSVRPLRTGRFSIAVCMVLVFLAAACAHGHQLASVSLRLHVDEQGRVTIHDKRTGATWEQATPVSEGPPWASI